MEGVTQNAILQKQQLDTDSIARGELRYKTEEKDIRPGPGP